MSSNQPRPRTYPVQRGQWFSFRRRVPADVALLVNTGDLTRGLGNGGETKSKDGRVWKVSLRTTQRKEAEKLARRLAAQTDALIRKAREEIARRRWVQVELSPADQAWLADEGGREGLRETLKRQRTQLPFVSFAAEILGRDAQKSRSALLEETPDPEGAAADGAGALAEAAALRKQIAELQALLNRAEGHRTETPVPGASVMGLADLLDRWKASDGKGRGITTVEAYAYAVRRFGELHGALALSAITRQHLVQFRDALASMPASGSQAVREASIQNTIAWAKANKAPLLSAGTVRNTVLKVASLLRFAQDEGLIETNPAAGFKPAPTDPKQKHAEAKGRVPFTPAEAKKVLEALEGEGTKEDRWLSLIAAYTGARIEELAQLRGADVKEVDGVWCLSIHDLHGRVKNRSSVRDVPIHSRLIEAGLLDYAKGIKADERLLPGLTPDKNGRLSGVASHRFSRWLKRKGFKRKGLSFHSWRHSFMDACRNVEMPPDVYVRIVGHVAGVVSRVSHGYGKGPNKALLRDWVNRVDPTK